MAQPPPCPYPWEVAVDPDDRTTACRWTAAPPARVPEPWRMCCRHRTGGGRMRRRPGRKDTALAVMAVLEGPRRVGSVQQCAREARRRRPTALTADRRGQECGIPGRIYSVWGMFLAWTWCCTHWLTRTAGS